MGCIYEVSNGEVIMAEHHNSLNDASGQATKTALMSGIYSTCIAFCGSYGDLTPYDDAIVDIYTDSGGYLNTVNTGNTTAYYDEYNDVYENYNCYGDAVSSNYVTCTLGGSGTCYADCCFVCARGANNYNCANALWCGCDVDISDAKYINYNTIISGVPQASTACACLCLKDFYSIGVNTSSSTNCVHNCDYTFKCISGYCYDFYINNVCQCQVEITDGLMSHYMCANAKAGSSNYGTAYVRFNTYYLYNIAEKVIEIDAQTFDSTTNTIFPTLELLSGSKDDITIDVEDGSSNVLACDVSLDDFGNFCTCCPTVLVKYKLGSCDLKLVKGHGYKVLSL